MFEIFKKKTRQETLTETYKEILNSAFSNIYVRDFYTEIPLIEIDGIPEQIQSAELFFSCVSSLALTIERPYVDERFKLHIFYGGFYVLEINYQKRMFIVLGRSDFEINNLDDIRNNQGAAFATLNQTVVSMLISTLKELEEINNDYYQVIKNYIFDNLYDYFINFLSKKKINKRRDSEGFVYCEIH